MALTLATNTRNAIVNAVTATIDADAGAGTLKIYTSPRPATPNDAPTGTLLATLTLADPSFAAAASGSADLDATPTLTTTAVASGTAFWFRVADNSGDAVLDGSITATGGGGDLEMNSVVISSGATVNITAGTMTEPGS